MKHALLASAAALVIVMAAPRVAVAQEPGAPTPGPLVVERVPNGFVIAPDYKVTGVNASAAQLAGVYGGRVIDDQLLIGGAAYWLVNGANDTSLSYGGLLLGWSTAPGRRIQFGARALAGVGHAAMDVNVPGPPDGPAPRPSAGLIRFGASSPVSPVPRPHRVRASDDFLVLEPQATIVLKVTTHVGVSCGVGYRLAAFSEVLGDRLQGATGSLGVQLGW